MVGSTLRSFRFVHPQDNCKAGTSVLINIFAAIHQSCIYSPHYTLTHCFEFYRNQRLEDVPCMVIHVPKYLNMIVVEYIITEMGCCM